MNANASRRPDEVVDYIVSHHHAYVRKALPTIARHTRCTREGSRERAETRRHRRVRPGSYVRSRIRGSCLTRTRASAECRRLKHDRPC